MNQEIKIIMDKIGEILSNTNASRFTVTGYTYLETRLVLHFDDCDQVFDFKLVSKGKVEVVNKFFSTDRDYLENSIKFEELHKSVKQE